MSLAEAVSLEPPKPAAPRASLANQLVPELYERLVASISAADEAILHKDAKARAEGLEAATAITFELMASVNMENGGELAPRLMALYSYFATELLYIGRTDDRQQIRGLLDMIGVLTGKWHDGGAKLRR